MEERHSDFLFLSEKSEDLNFLRLEGGKHSGELFQAELGLCVYAITILLIVSRDYLEHITAIGPRTTGSTENEILTVQYLLEQIKLIEAQSNSLHSISVDIQRPTGSFSIDFLGGFTSYYDNITNVVVKLEPRDGAESAILANCHFDSVANSPGRYLYLVI